ncbi:MAG: hypothetical protein JWP63_2643 [Candidatus Solibacter sp.]|nr:hypothetical protein [Candidatus Solibacter sp.]
MIAGVNGWFAVFSALLVCLPPDARAADDLSGAVRELARKTVAYAGRGEPVSLSWRNLSSLGSAEFNQARAAFESALREAGGRASEIAPIAEARLTLSENAAQILIVEEIRKGDERQVWIAGWKRTAAAAPASAGMSLEKKLLWEQEEQILDVAPLDDGVLVLSPSKLVLRVHGATQWLPVTAQRPWPRDLRGHIRVSGGGFKASLPGMTCIGTLEPALAGECRASDEPWTLDTGSHGVLLANFAAARNYFDGRVAAANGVRKTLPPFFSIAPVEEGGKIYWVVALPGGRTQILDGAFEVAGSVTGWGSDLAWTEARCGGGSQVLATRAGDPHEPDTLRAFALVNRAAVPLTAALDMPGPVTALWTIRANAAIAVVRDLATGRYAAYGITVNCGE